MECKICGVAAHYSYFGVISCDACKIFFRRNVKKRRQLKCRDNGKCKINSINRQTCPHCRLEKCFTTGMQPELIRASTGSRTTTKVCRYLTNNSNVLTTNQWCLLSNLTHCYDEYSGYSLAEDYLREQNYLPIKMRFKPLSIGQLIILLAGRTQFLYEKNLDFLSLDLHDRSLLFHTTVKTTLGLSSGFILRSTNLFYNLAFGKSIEILYGPNTFIAATNLINSLDFDIIFLKLILSILTLTQFGSTENLRNQKLIFNIQNKYIEITWLYLIYRYNYKQAIIIFSNMIRSLFLVDKATVEAHDSQNYTQIVDSLVEQTSSIIIE